MFNVNDRVSTPHGEDKRSRVTHWSYPRDKVNFDVIIIFDNFYFYITSHYSCIWAWEQSCKPDLFKHTVYDFRST